MQSEKLKKCVNYLFEKETHKIKLSEKMGYRGDVESTRISLEKLFTSDIIGITTTV